jgi:hypothetical protein
MMLAPFRLVYLAGKCGNKEGARDKLEKLVFKFFCIKYLCYQ